MAIKIDIIDKMNFILNNQMDTKDTLITPDIYDSSLTFDLTAKRFKCVCFHIDMRGSTAILEKHNSNAVIKIHKAFFSIILMIVKKNKGEVRSFNGDSVLAFFPGNNQNAMESAIRAAMGIKFMIMIDEHCLYKEVLKKYNTKIDIGIGLDIGTVTTSKVGISGDNNRDLIWIGSNVNRAVKISDQLKGERNIGITERLYKNLPNIVKFSNYINMWSINSFKYNNVNETVYVTSYHWEVS